MSLSPSSFSRGRAGWASRGTGLLLVSFLCLLFASLSAPAAAVALPDLGVQVPDPLSPLTSPAELELSGLLGATWPGARLRIEVTGPRAPSLGLEDRPVSGTFEVDLGDLPSTWTRSVTVPPELVAIPGAYHVRIRLTSGADRSVDGSAWLGRVPAARSPVQLALVWPVALGAQRNPEGVFVSSRLREAVRPQEGELSTILGLGEEYSGWHFTLAVEPLLLTQLADLADGYQELTNGRLREVGEDDPSAAQAAQALNGLATAARSDPVQVIPMPFASPHLPWLAREGWDDGLEQMQLGKSELVKELDLPSIPEGAYPPGLELTAESLRYFSEASIEYAVAAVDPSRDLTQAPESGEGPIRVRDAEGHRLTLLPANEEMRQAQSFWDPGLFFAALASEIAEGRTGPLVVTPPADYELPPGAYLEKLGEVLTRNPWIRTVTLAEVISSHPPATRPVFFVRQGNYAQGFVAETLSREVRRVRGLLGDFAEATSSDRAPLDRLRLYLYLAESRYWMAEGSDPSQADTGLAYARAVEKLIAHEFDKVDVAGDKSVIVIGDEGDVPVAIVNQTGYPLELRLTLRGRGLVIKGEEQRLVTLGPQENIVTLPVSVRGGSGEVEVLLSAGGLVLDEGTVKVRALSVNSVLPWVLGLLFTSGFAGLLLVRRARR